MPARLSRRKDEARVAPRSAAHADAFAKGLKAFIDESRTLARCEHPSLVRVVRLCEANGTAYRVMPRYPAKRLLEVRQGLNQPPDEESVRDLLDALLGALHAYHHAAGCHGKVTPANILLLADNQPLLLGPGASGRAVASDPIDALMTSAEPCFAPIEQLVEDDTPLHPSVDLYALAGVARYWMSGELPPPAFGARSAARHERLADTVQRLCRTSPGLHYSASLVNALDNALSIYPAERPQSVKQMRTRLDGAPRPAGATVSAVPTAAALPNDDVPFSLAPTPPVEQRHHAAESSAAAAPSDAMPSTPEQASESVPSPRVEQPLDGVMASASDPEAPATCDVARIVDDPSVRIAFASPVSSSRRISIVERRGSGGVGAAARGDPRVWPGPPASARVLDVLGVSSGTSAVHSGALSASSVAAAAPGTPSIAADGGAAKPMPSEPAAPGPSATDTAASAVGASTGANAGAAEPASTDRAAANSPAVDSSFTSPASSDRVTPAVAPAAAPPPPVTQPPFPTPPSTRVTQHDAPAAPTSPREVCGARTQFSLYRCMQTQCSQRRWASHAQCERLRTTDSVD